MVIEQNQQLKKALDEYLRQSVSGLPSELELSSRQSFSAAFERKMRRLIRKSRKMDAVDQTSRSEFKMRKRLLLTAVILSILISAMSITAAREAVWGLMIRIYETFSTIIFNQGPGDQTAPSTQAPLTMEDLEIKLTAALPQGYKKVDQLSAESFMQIIYVHPNGDELIFERQASNTLQVLIDTEGIQAEDVQVGQSQGVYYANKGLQTLIWQDGRFVFTIAGKITKDELLNLAKSIN